jgi:hypothetical protein
MNQKTYILIFDNYSEIRISASNDRTAKTVATAIHESIWGEMRLYNQHMELVGTKQNGKWS